MSSPRQPSASSSRHAPSKAEVVGDFRRRQILNAARAAFGRCGLRDTTVSHIAREARVAKGTVYLYFQSKDDILRHALDDGIEGLREVTLPAIEGHGPLEARLAAFLRTTLAFFDQNRSFMDLCQLELGQEIRRRARQQFGQIYAAQIDAWERQLGRRSKAGPSARHLARLIVSMAHGLAMQRQRGWSDASLDEDVAAATRLLLKGLGA